MTGAAKHKIFTANPVLGDVTCWQVAWSDGGDTAVAILCTVRQLQRRYSTEVYLVGKVNLTEKRMSTKFI